MNRSRLALFLLIATVLLAACEPANFQDTTGHRGRFSDYRGKWLVINYWASWCKPCIHEIPEINAFAAANTGKVVVFGVDFDNNQGKKLRQGIDKLGIRFPVLTSDPAPILGFKRPDVLPTTYLIDPQGRLHKTLVGAQTRKTLNRAMGG